MSIFAVNQSAKDLGRNSFSNSRSGRIAIAVGLLKVCQACVPILHAPAVGTIISWTLEILQAIQLLELNLENAQYWSDLSQRLNDIISKAKCPLFLQLIHDFAEISKEISYSSQKILTRSNFFSKLFHFASDRRKLELAKIRYDHARETLFMQMILYFTQELFAIESQVGSLTARVVNLESAIRSLGFEDMEAHWHIRTSSTDLPPYTNVTQSHL